MTDEYEKKLRALTKQQQEENTEEEPGFQDGTGPLPQIESIIEQARSMAKSYGILLPPPFLPEFPRLPAARKQHDMIEEIPTAPPGPETEKEVTELTAEDHYAVEILNREGLSSDRIAATLKVPIRLVLKALEKPKVELPGNHSSSQYNRRRF